MLADVGHVDVVLVHARFAQGVAKQRLERARRAGGDHHPVQPLVADGVRDRLGGIGGAGKQGIFDVDHARQAQGVLGDIGHIDDAADVGTAATDKDTDLGFVLRDILFHRIDPVRRELAAPRLEQVGDLGASTAGPHHRLGNVHRPLEGAARENARSAGLQRVEGLNLAKAVVVEFNAKDFGKTLGILGRCQADREHDQFKKFLDHTVRCGVADRDVTGHRVFAADRDVAAHEMHVGQILRALVEALKVLAVGANVVVKNLGVHVRQVVLGQDHLLLRVRAAHGRAVAVGAVRVHLARADAVNPGDLVRMLLVRGAQDLPLVRTGGTQQALEVHAGDDVLEHAVAVIVARQRVVGFVARRQDDGADLDLDFFGLLAEVDGIVFTDGLADIAGLVLQEQAAVVDVSDQRYRLCKVDVYGLVQRQVLIEGIGDLDRAALDAGGASRAFVGIDVARLFQQRDGEVSGLALDAVDIGVGHQLDVGRPVGFDELRRLDAHRAVVGREGLVELRHFAADGRRLLDQIDLVTIR